MRFGRVLHPEIVLNKRGDKFEREFFSKALKIAQIDTQKGGLTWECSELDPLAMMIAHNFQEDAVFLRLIVSCLVYVSQRGQTYHVGQDFLQALQKIDRKIPVDILPERFCAYFSFASNVVFDDSDSVQGGYVCIDRGRNLGMGNEFADMRVITFAYVCSPTPSHPIPPIASLTIQLDAKTLDELADGAPLKDYYMPVDYDPTANAKRNEVFRTLLNCVLYIHSTEPIVEVSRPLAESNKTIKEHKRDGLIINACTIPVHFLHPHYQQERQYRVDSTWVDSFPRWQRCGPGLTSVKLVFVKGHERTFKNSESHQSV